MRTFCNRARSGNSSSKFTSKSCIYCPRKAWSNILFTHSIFHVVLNYFVLLQIWYFRVFVFIIKNIKVTKIVFNICVCALMYNACNCLSFFFFCAFFFSTMFLNESNPSVVCIDVCHQYRIFIFLCILIILA